MHIISGYLYLMHILIMGKPYAYRLIHLARKFKTQRINEPMFDNTMHNNLYQIKDMTHTDDEHIVMVILDVLYFCYNNNDIIVFQSYLDTELTQTVIILCERRRPVHSENSISLQPRYWPSFVWPVFLFMTGFQPIGQDYTCVTYSRIGWDTVQPSITGKL